MFTPSRCWDGKYLPYLKHGNGEWSEERHIEARQYLTPMEQVDPGVPRSVIEENENARCAMRP